MVVKRPFLMRKKKSGKKRLSLNMQIVFFTTNQKKIKHSNTLPCAILEHI